MLIDPHFGHANVSDARTVGSWWPKLRKVRQSGLGKSKPVVRELLHTGFAIKSVCWRSHIRAYKVFEHAGSLAGQITGRSTYRYVGFSGSAYHGVVPKSCMVGLLLDYGVAGAVARDRTDYKFGDTIRIVQQTLPCGTALGARSRAFYSRRKI